MTLEENPKENDLKRRGMLLILSSASGTGKTTLSRMLVDKDPDIVVSTSTTTRAKRPGEVNGKDYFFVSDEEFQRQVEAGVFLEHAEVFGHMYGTAQEQIERLLASGKDVLFDIDWQGTRQLSEAMIDDVVTIFILPPTRKELESRLVKRGQDSEETIRYRMERSDAEMAHYGEYHYVFVNYDIDESLSYVESILKAERMKRRRLSNISNFVKGLSSDGS